MIFYPIVISNRKRGNSNILFVILYLTCFEHYYIILLFGVGRDHTFDNTFWPIIGRSCSAVECIGHLFPFYHVYGYPYIIYYI